MILRRPQLADCSKPIVAGCRKAEKSKRQFELLLAKETGRSTNTEIDECCDESSIQLEIHSMLRYFDSLCKGRISKMGYIMIDV